MSWVRSSVFHVKMLDYVVGNSRPLTTTAKATPQILSSNHQQEEVDKLYRLLEVEIRGNAPAVLKSYSWFATTAATELGIKVGDCFAPRKADHDRLTLLKSVHIYKKHRVQYEVRTYFRFLRFLQLTGSTSDTFLEYIQRNLPEGVAMKVTRFGLETLPSHISAPS